MLALVMQWLLIQTQYMMSSLTLGIRAPAAIPRASNITPRMDRRIGGYNTLKKFLIIYCLINTCILNNFSVPVSCCNTTNPLANETTCPDIVMHHHSGCAMIAVNIGCVLFVKYERAAIRSNLYLYLSDSDGKCMC